MLQPSIPKFRKARGRLKSQSFDNPPPPPGPVTVVAVKFVNENSVYWKFSSPVVSYDEVTGFTVGEQVPSGVELTSEGWLLIDYAGEVAGGDVWEVMGAVAVVFEGGGELELPESGTVTS